MTQLGMKEASVAPATIAPAAAEFSIDARFGFTSQLVEMVATGQTASTILVGEGGLGKSYTVTKALKASGLQDISEMEPGSVVAPRMAFRVIKGFSTAKGLYRTLYENRNSIVVLDDVDSLLKDPDALNLLKGALDSYDKRIISWNTNASDDGLPRSFEFTGGVVFISNIRIDKIDQALRSRSMVVDLSMTMDEKIERMGSIMADPEFMPEVEMNCKKDALELIGQYKDVAKEVSMRTLIKVTKIRTSGNANWAELAKYALLA
jgi:replication-associated recombination protein RarA